MFQPMPERAYRAGESLEDYCRACKTDRLHTVIVADASGRPIRVTCDYCESQHNYRGGGRIEPSGSMPVRAPLSQPSTSPSTPSSAAVRERNVTPVAPEPCPDSADQSDLERLLRRVIREETGLTPVTPAAKWRGGTLVLKPGNGTQEKSVPIDTLFNKIVMLRNRLRTLEQQVNASDLPDDQKLKLQGYVTGCYGSLTTFNVLFADDADGFKGSGGGD
jgi:hypothetical protein